MSSAKPSLELLRSLTDEHILRALMAVGRLTRAEIAARTGISKPTISEGVRRLEEAGILIDTGKFSTGRGRAGNYYTLSPTCGVGLAASIAPGAVTAETVDPFGAVLARAVVDLDRSPGLEGAASALAAAAREVIQAASRTVRTTVVSAADPVDRSTGRLVRLPDAPFMVGELDPTAALRGLVRGPVVVDNDANWAARAERVVADLPDPDNFIYLYLGEGLGCAVVCEGEVWRGNNGLAGEIAHLVTTGAGGRAARFTDVFEELGFRSQGSTSIDVNRVVRALRGEQVGSASSDACRQLARAVAGVLSATIALADPSAAVIGGNWGREPSFIEALRSEFDSAPRSVTIQVSALEKDPDLAGARTACIELLQDSIARPYPALPFD